MRDDSDVYLAGGEDPAPDAVGPDLVAPEPAVRRERPTASAWAGAAFSLLVLAGLGLWAQDLLTRDTGRIPIIAARIGPVKTPPEAGPPPLAHADIESYALGEAETATPSELAEEQLAPPRPVPTEEDVALGAMPLPAPREALAPEPEPKPEAGTQIAAIDPAAAVELAAVSDVEPAEGLAEPEPEPEPVAPVPPAGTGSALAPVATAPAPVRPSDLQARMVAARRSAEAEQAALKVAAAEAPYQLQLGAFRTEALTRGAWDRIARAHSELLSNRRLAVQTTVSGGETFYRLRVGPFTSLAEAASLCEALRARGQDCIPAANR